MKLRLAVGKITLGIALLAVSGAAWAGGTLEVKYSNDFGLYNSPYYQTGALKVTAVGGDVSGSLIVKHVGNEFKYPVSVRQNESVVIQAPRPESVSLRHADGAETYLPYEYGDNSNDYNTLGPVHLAVIGDRVFASKSALDVATQAQNGIAQEVIEVTSMKAEDAPTDFTGYSYAHTVVLSHGAERMSDAALEALKQAVSYGTELVVVGGANPVWESDPRLANLVPTETNGTVQADISQIFPLYHGTPMTLAVMDPVRATRLTYDAGGKLATVSRPFGVGNIVAVSYDPTDPGVDAYQSNLFQALPRSFTPLVVPGVMQSGAGQDNSALGHPFAPTTMPPVWVMAALLIGYMVVVIPVNLLILRAIKKPELAWVTAPGIAVLFAGMALGSSAKLYMAPNSDTTIGTIVLNQGEETGYFCGTSTVFYPHAGVYPVVAPHSQAVSLVSGGDGYMTTDFTSQPPARSVRVPNLSYKGYGLWGQVSAKDWMRVERVNGTQYRVTNLSDSPLMDITITSSSALIPKIDPGSSALIQAKNDQQIKDVGQGLVVYATSKSHYFNVAADKNLALLQLQYVTGIPVR